MTRVLVIAGDPSARARLADLVEELAGWTVAAQVDADDLELLAAGADAVLWDLGPDTAAARRQIAGRLDLDLPVVLLGPRDVAAEALSAGASAYLSEEVSARRVGLALEAAVEGLQVADQPSASAPRPSEEAPLEELTPRESDVLQLLAEGFSNRAIAERLLISEHTVKFHVNAILGKLGAHTRTEAVTRAARQGLIIL